MKWLRKNEADFDDEVSQDHAVTDCMADMAYNERRDPTFGRFLLSSMNHLYPAMKGKFYHAARALASWKELKLERGAHGNVNTAAHMKLSLDPINSLYTRHGM